MTILFGQAGPTLGEVLPSCLGAYLFFPRPCSPTLGQVDWFSWKETCPLSQPDPPNLNTPPSLSHLSHEDLKSFMLTEVRDCDLLIVVTSSTFLKRKDMLKEKSVSPDHQNLQYSIYIDKCTVYTYTVYMYTAL